ncbi:MAG: methyltransferase domain-containing protein [Actinomycetota bacterium]
MIGPTGISPPASLRARYSPQDLTCFSEEELQRFLGPALANKIHTSWDETIEALAWEILYRKEPELYDRMIAGEPVSEGLLDWLPIAGDVVEVAAGTGRLTLSMPPRWSRLVAVEPVAAMRKILEARIAADRKPDICVVEGYFDRIALPDAWADVVITCSSFTTDPGHGGQRGLDELTRITRKGGKMIFISPTDIGWFIERGFDRIDFPAQQFATFANEQEARSIASVFYPYALDDVLPDGRVSFDALGIEPPHEAVWMIK